MKHNPRLHERVAALPGHARLHPLQHPRRAQGALELMWNLERALAEVSGLPHVSLQPSAGSHGELAGVLLSRAYHEARGETRTKVLTPDTAHGTNPATVTMAGDGGREGRHGARRRRRPRRPAREGRRRASPASCSRTRTRSGSSTRTSPRSRTIVHDVGATLYYDGANLNAIMGITRPGDMGFDIVHFNLHKSFTQPHGGGGPGSGPIAVSDRMEPYLMDPRIVRLDDGGFDLRERLAGLDRPAARVPGQLRVLRALLRVHPLARRGGAARRERDGRPQRELPARPPRRPRAAAAARARRALHARVRPVRRADEARAGHPHARPGEAAARPRVPPADGVLPAARRRGAAHRADRDRDARDARRVRRGRSRRSSPRRPRTRRSRGRRRTRRRCGGSTRPARRSGR